MGVLGVDEDAHFKFRVAVTAVNGLCVEDI